MFSPAALAHGRRHERRRSLPGDGRCLSAGEAMTTEGVTRPALGSGTFRIGGDLPVVRLGFGSMRLTGPGIWGEPRDHDGAIRVLLRAVELGVNFIDTADSYGPYVSERLIGEALRRLGPSA